MHRKIMKDEYGPGMNWYRCAMQNLDHRDEEEEKPDQNLEGPVLMIVAKEDPLSNAMAINGMKEFVANLKVVEIECGHWLQIEKRHEVNTALEEFFKTFEKEL